LENKEIFSVSCRKKEHLSKKNCPLRNIWQKIQNLLNSTLDEITLSDLLKNNKKTS